MKGANQNMSICQALSQRQSSDFISHVLNNWKNSAVTNGRVPHEIVMDNSSALLLACVRSFTFCGTTNNYLSDCFDSLLRGTEPPHCFIRLDRSHMVKIIADLKCLKTEDKRKQKLFRRIFGFLMKNDDIKLANNIIRGIFILLFNKYENEKHVKDAKISLKNVADKHALVELEEPYNEFDTHMIETEVSNRSKFHSWVAALAKDVKAHCVNEALNTSDSINEKENSEELIDNIYYAPHLEDPFIELLATLPLWSNVMNHQFGSNNFCPSSSMTEVEFKNIKRLVFNGQRSIRVDTFVRHHIQHVNGTMKLALAENKKVQMIEDANTKEENAVSASGSSENIFVDEMQQEIWRDKNDDIKVNTNKFKFVKRCRTSILEPHRPISRKVPILKNGHKKTGTKKGNTPYTVTLKTCSFDSVFHAFAACYFDIDAFKQRVESDNSRFSRLMKTALDLQDKAQTYTERDEILFELFPECFKVSTETITVFDCEMSIATMFMRLCQHFEILNSLEEHKYCDKCEKSLEKVQKTFVPTNLNNVNIEQLQESIVQNFATKSNCAACGERLTKLLEYNNIVAIDFEKTQPKEVYYVDFANISNQIYLNNRKYALKAVIDYIDNIEHFVTHVLRNDNKWETFDDLHIDHTLKPAARIHPVLLFYTVVDENCEFPPVCQKIASTNEHSWAPNVVDDFSIPHNYDYNSSSFFTEAKYDSPELEKNASTEHPSDPNDADDTTIISHNSTHQTLDKHYSSEKESNEADILKSSYGKYQNSINQFDNAKRFFFSISAYGIKKAVVRIEKVDFDGTYLSQKAMGKNSEANLPILRRTKREATKTVRFEYGRK